MTKKALKLEHVNSLNGNNESEEAIYLGELYAKVAPRFTGRATAPALWDKKIQTIVNNESADIIRMLNTEFISLTGEA